MKIAAVIIDAWKLGVFKRHLEAEGYEWAADLKLIVEAAQAECAKPKGMMQ